TALTLALLLAGTAASQEAKKPPSPEALQFFETKVRPLLVEQCHKCHGEKKQRGSLRLDSLTAILEGGDQGAALVPGHPEKSLIIKAISHEDKDLKMPPENKLTREQIEHFKQWIKLGAPWPGGAKEPVAKRNEALVTAKDREHWSFRPIS